jgi:hypothetical protein
VIGQITLPAAYDLKYKQKSCSADVGTKVLDASPVRNQGELRLGYRALLFVHRFWSTTIHSISKRAMQSDSTVQFHVNNGLQASEDAQVFCINFKS